MQPIDPESCKTEPKEVLCLLSFTEDGAVRWSSSIGNVSADFVQRMVHVFRASISISGAFLKVIGDTVPPNDSSRAQQHKERYDKAVIVKCERTTVILAKHVHDRSDTWFALIGRPLVLQNDTICNEILNTLEEVASVLFPSTEQQRDNLYELCESISRSITSIPFWSDGAHVTHFVDSLVNFCDAQIAQRKERKQELEYYDATLYSSSQTSFKESLESFHTEVSHHCSASQVRLCIFCQDMKPLYAEKLHLRETDLLGWYFSTCLNVRFRAFSNIFSERDKGGSLHVWYKRRGLILFTNFPSTKGDSGYPSRSFQYAADALIDAVPSAVK